jgi:hypothetical protein
VGRRRASAGSTDRRSFRMFSTSEHTLSCAKRIDAMRWKPITHAKALNAHQEPFYPEEFIGAKRQRSSNRKSSDQTSRRTLLLLRPVFRGQVTIASVLPIHNSDKLLKSTPHLPNLAFRLPLAIMVPCPKFVYLRRLLPYCFRRVVVAFPGWHNDAASRKLVGPLNDGPQIRRHDIAHR